MNHECGAWKEKTLSAGLLTLRLFLGLAIANHGYQKVFGGQVFMLAQGLAKMEMPAPVFLAWLASLAEFAGGVCIAIGLGTRIAAFFVFFTMAAAFFKAHANDPFQIKELAYLYGSGALSLILTGGGCYAVEMLFCRGGCKPEGKPA